MRYVTDSAVRDRYTALLDQSPELRELSIIEIWKKRKKKNVKELGKVVEDLSSLLPEEEEGEGQLLSYAITGYAPGTGWDNNTYRLGDDIVAAPPSEGEYQEDGKGHNRIYFMDNVLIQRKNIITSAWTISTNTINRDVWEIVNGMRCHNRDPKANISIASYLTIPSKIDNIPITEQMALEIYYELRDNYCIEERVNLFVLSKDLKSKGSKGMFFPGVSCCSLPYRGFKPRIDLTKLPSYQPHFSLFERVINMFKSSE